MGIVGGGPYGRGQASPLSLPPMRLGAPAVLRRRVGGAVISWTPADLPGTNAQRTWYSARDIGGLSVGEAVSSIPPRFGAVNLVQSISSAKPSYQLGINGLPSVRHASDDYMHADSKANRFNGDDQPYSWFGVFKWGALPSVVEYAFCIGLADNLNPFIGPIRIPSSNDITSIRVGVIASSGTNITTNPTALGIVFKGTVVDFWINAVKVASNIALNADAISGLIQYTIGANRRSTIGNFMNADWGEFFDTTAAAVDDATAELAHLYLMQEWNF